MIIVTGDKTKHRRRQHDFYPTPQPAADAIVALAPAYDLPDAPFIIDVGSGGGPFGRAARARWPNAIIWGLEIDERFRHRADLSAYDDVLYVDFTELLDDLREMQLRNLAVDLVIGNPPFIHAHEAMELAITLLKPNGWALYLFKLAFLATYTRYEQFYTRRPYLPVATFPLVNRPSFDGTGNTDAQEYGAVLLRNDLRWPLPCVMGQTDWKHEGGYQLPLFGDRVDPERLALDLIRQTVLARHLMSA